MKVVPLLCIWFLYLTDAENSSKRSLGSLNKIVQQADRENKADRVTYDCSLLLTDTKDKARKRRNVISTTSELSANKQLVILQNLNNLDIFRISVSGSALAAIYDFRILENVAGLEVSNFVNPDQTFLNVQSDTISYQAGNVAEGNSVSLSYDANLRNFGAEIATLHNITTTMTYFTTPTLANQQTLELNLCIAKVVETINTACAWCWSILIIFVCFLVGLLLAFLAMMLLVLCSKSSTGISPFSQKSTSFRNASKMDSRQNDVISITDVLAMTNERKVAYSLELLQLQQLIELEDRLEVERKEMSDAIEKVMIRQDHRKGESGGKSTSKHLHYKRKRKEIVATQTKHLESFYLDVKDSERKRNNELSVWTERLSEYSSEFQNEMILLVEQRFDYDATDEQFFQNLKELLTECYEKVYEDENEKNLELKNDNQDNGNEKSNFDYKLLKAEDSLLQGIIEIYFSSIFKLQQMFAKRGEIIGKFLSDLKEEKETWEKLKWLQLDVVHMAERKDMITGTTGKAIAERINKRFSSILDTFAKEKQTALDQVNKEYRETNHRLRHRRNDVGVTHDEVTAAIKNRLVQLKRELENEANIKSQLDSILFRYVDNMSSVMSQTRKEIKRGKGIIADMLMEADVDESWLEQTFKKKNDELTTFYEDLESSSNVTSLAPTKRLVTSRRDDVTWEILSKAKALQTVTSRDDDVRLLNDRVKSRKEILRRSAIGHIEMRLQSFNQLLEFKKDATEEVAAGKNQKSIRLELQEKLFIAAEEKKWIKKEKKKENLRKKRYQSIKLRHNISSMLSDQLYNYYQTEKKEHDLSRERFALDDLIMTLMQLMTSYGVLASRDCRMVLEEFRSEAEEIKHSFSLEQKMKEDYLKRKFEESDLDEKYENPKLETQGQEFASIDALLLSSDDVIATSLGQVTKDRSRIQELFDARRAISLDQERSLIDKKLLSISNLASAAGVDRLEMTNALHLLLPWKSQEDLVDLCHVICPDVETKKQTAQSGDLLKKVRQLVIRKLENQTSKRKLPRKKLQFFDSHLHPGVRPDPIGRTATPDEMERF